MAGLGTLTPASLGVRLYHLHVGELDEAANWYQVMIDERDPFALVYANAPVTLPLHAHPRWPALAAQMRLPAKGIILAHFAGRLNTRGQLPGPCVQVPTIWPSFRSPA